MKIQDKDFRTIWIADDGADVVVIDQTVLPHRLQTQTLRTVGDAEIAIRTMVVRGAPLIGATAAYGMALAMREDPTALNINRAGEFLKAARPTAVNLAWAVDKVSSILRLLPERQRTEAAYAEAARICEEDVASCRAIGEHGAIALRTHAPASGPMNILTHCNAGWLATVDFGTALSPVYALHDAGVPVHVWVDETRPRNQGASLTAWELANHGVPHTLIADNTGGHLMRQSLVHACIVGADRVAANGDVCNKIGTYLKALAAHDNGVPFYVAMPHSTIDWSLSSGDEIPIEARESDEVLYISGLSEDGVLTRVRLAPDSTRAANFAFDVTPSRLVSAFVTELGVCPASKEGLTDLYTQVG